jgi:uncharacterized membrane protein
VYPPIFSIPSAIGIGIGKLLNLRITHTLYISRILSAIATVAIGAFAVIVSGAAAPWIFTILMLPTALSLSATSGQDGLLNATAAFACACVARLAVQRDGKLAIFYDGKLAIFYASCIALLLVISARPPLLPLALVSLAVPRVSWRHRVIGLAIVIIGTVGWMIAAAPTYIHPRIGMDSTINPDDFGTVKQLDYIIAHPLAYYSAFTKTLRTFGPNFYHAFIGVLGWYDVFVPRWYIFAVSINFVLALAASMSKRDGPWLPEAAMAGIAVVGCFVAVLTAQYLAWTPVGLDIILGVQGRYLVAPALFVVLLCPPLTLPRPISLIFTASTVAFAAVVTVPLTYVLIVNRYYLS